MGLEDKTVVDALWDRAGVPRVASRVVPVAWDELVRAHEALDLGRGTVWAADNRLGWHGGAEFTRWVHDLADAKATIDEFRPAADRIRVMPFLDGIPCSIHGMVFPDCVVALRPCEMMVLRNPGSRSFRYAQAATFWDPRPSDREEMRETARMVGAELRRSVGFRGAFTIDGVLTAQGFRPTELNARFGAALGLMGRGFPGLRLPLLNMAVVEGLEVDWRPRDLEADLLVASDASRVAGGMTVVQSSPEPGKSWFRWKDGAWIPSLEEERDVEVVIGPSNGGTVLILRLVPERLAVGNPVAPVIASLLCHLDAQLDLGIGPVEAAPDVRPA